MLSIRVVSIFNERIEYPTKFSLSSLRLGAYVADLSADVRIETCSIFADAKDVAKKFLGVDVVGLSGYMWTIDKSMKIANEISLISPETTIVIGGPSVADVKINEWPAKTIFVLGEGEIPFRAICKGEAHSAIFSRHISKSNAMPYYSVGELSTGLPLFSKELELITGEIEDRKFTWYDTCAGCIFKCGYCGHRTHPFVCTRSIDLVKNEIQNIGKMDFERVFIVDPIIGGNPDRSKKILQLFQRYAPSAKLKFYFRSEFLSKEMITYLGESNTEEIFIGLQSFNQNLPGWIRNNDLTKIKKYLPSLSYYRIPWRAELIIGLPGDDFLNLCKSFRYVIDELRPISIWAYHLTSIKGTRISEITGGKSNSDGEGYWLQANPKTFRVEASNSYTEIELCQMLAFGGGMASLYNYFMERGERIVSFEKIKKIVESVIMKNDNVAKIFSSGNMFKSKEFWRIYIDGGSHENIDWSTSEIDSE